WFEGHHYYWVYTLDDVLPRSFVVSRWAIYNNSDEALNALDRMSVKDIAKTAVFSRQDIRGMSLPDKAHTLEWSSKIIQYGPDTIHLEGHANQSSILVLTDNFNRHWSATVNGHSAAIMPVYNTFRAVQVPEGAFSVKFHYADPILWFMYFLTFA